MRGVVVLGSTGSIGTQALEIIGAHPEKFKVIAIVARSNIEIILEQIKKFNPRFVVVSDKKKASLLGKRTGLQIFHGESKIMETIKDPETDIVINSLVGRVGLQPSIETLKFGKTLGLAHKESMVLAGELLMKLSKVNSAPIIPIDSEHSAIFQSLKSGSTEEIRRIILTMGTGEIAKMSEKELHEVTMEQVMKRKTWTMGSKISVDSATCMNKAFEIIEAGHLFGIPSSKIEVVVHPEYSVHSLVEFRDGSIITEIGTPDMRRYIQYALFYPKRPEAKVSGFHDLLKNSISFNSPPEGFPALRLGFEALKAGGTMPAVLHGADTAAVEAFTEKKIRFTDIAIIVEKTMAAHENVKDPTLPEILEAEEWAETYARKVIAR